MHPGLWQMHPVALLGHALLLRPLGQVLLRLCEHLNPVRGYQHLVLELRRSRATLGTVNAS